MGITQGGVGDEAPWETRGGSSRRGRRTARTETNRDEPTETNRDEGSSRRRRRAAPYLTQQARGPLLGGVPSSTAGLCALRGVSSRGL